MTRKFSSLTAALLFLAIGGHAGPSLAQKPGGISSSTFSKPQPVSHFSPSFGIKFGAAETEGIYNTSTVYGVEAAIQPYAPFTAALEYGEYATGSEENLSSMARSYLIAKATYSLSGTIPLIRHSYFGGGIGPVWDRRDKKTSANTGISPEIGFDIPLADLESLYSLGANANYLFVGGTKDDVFALNAMIKYWY